MLEVFNMMSDCLLILLIYTLKTNYLLFFQRESITMIIVIHSYLHFRKYVKVQCYDFFIFLAFNFCRFCVVIRFYHPRHNDLRLRRIFYTRFYRLHLFSYLNSWERASIFPFNCSVLNKGTTGTIFITSLVWRGPWLGIEPGTSGTRSQHYTTRLSRGGYVIIWVYLYRNLRGSIPGIRRVSI